MGDALADQVQKVLKEKNLTVDVVIPVSTIAVFRQVSRSSTELGSRYVARRCTESGAEVELAVP